MLKIGVSQKFKMVLEIFNFFFWIFYEQYENGKSY